MLLGALIGVPLNLMAEAGTIDEQVARDVAHWGKMVGDVFLRLLTMIVVPLILCSLISGVTSSANLKGLGRIGGVTFVYYMLTSSIAIVTGLVLVNTIRPGDGAELVDISAGNVRPGIIEESQGVGDVLWDQLMVMIPKNPFAAIADPTNGGILGVIFFALLFGIFIVKVGGEHGKRLSSFFQSAFTVMMDLTMALIRLAPIGVLGFMIYATAGQGFGVFASLGFYMITVAIGLLFHGMVTMPLILFFIARRSPWQFAKAMSPAMLTAFSTASSNGTLPLTMTCVEQRAGVPNRVGSFVLPLGATINMDGTALYETVAVLFIAQAYGASLGIAEQAIVALTALLVSIGAAGIPHAGTVMMVTILAAVKLPVEAVGLILAVDRVLDMSRTVINIWGDSVATAVVTRFVGTREEIAGPAPGGT